VTIESVGATIYPRVTVTLKNLSVGQPAGAHIASLDVGTDFRALLSRRIEHASARVEGAKIQLPLMPLGKPAPPGTDSARANGMASAPIQLVSVDEIVLSDVAVVSGGRTLSAVA
jgi:hypothetical protein